MRIILFFQHPVNVEIKVSPVLYLNHNYMNYLYNYLHFYYIVLYLKLILYYDTEFDG
jgi:hypothetical protein